MAQGTFCNIDRRHNYSADWKFDWRECRDMIFVLGKMAATFTGAGIGVGVAYRFKESPLVVLSAATAGMVGAFAAKLLAGSVLRRLVHWYLQDRENRWEHFLRLT